MRDNGPQRPAVRPRQPHQGGRHRQIRGRDKKYGKSWFVTTQDPYFAIILTGVEILVSFGYFIYAAIQGFKYCVMSDMDEEGVKHTQMPRQFRKAQAISVITILMGTTSAKPGITGTGLLAASKGAMSSSRKTVKSVEIIRKHDVIKVNGKLNKNQVYALPEDFPFVENFIRSHVSQKCSIKEE